MHNETRLVFVGKSWPYCALLGKMNMFTNEKDKSVNKKTVVQTGPY